MWLANKYCNTTKILIVVHVDDKSASTWLVTFHVTEMCNIAQNFARRNKFGGVDSLRPAFQSFVL